MGSTSRPRPDSSRSRRCGGELGSDQGDEDRDGLNTESSPPPSAAANLAEDLKKVHRIENV